MATNFDLDLYGDILGGENLEGAEQEDFLTGGTEVAYCFATWLSGMQGKTPIVIKQGNNWVEDGDRQASGIWFEAEKTPADLREVIDQLAAPTDAEGKKRKPLAEFAHVQHDDGTVKLYWRVFDPDYFVLAHGIPSQWSVMHYDKNEKAWTHDPAKELGIARGTVTREDAKNDKQSTYNFFGFLVVMRQLAFLYVDEQGRPKPLLMNFKSINTGVIERELGYHFAFVKEHRDWYANIFLPNDEGFLASFGKRSKPEQARAAKIIAQRHIQFWTHSLRIDRTPNRIKHETKNAAANSNQTGFQKVYEPMNHSRELYAQHEEAEKILYCGEKLHRNLMSFVYDTSVQPMVPGGEAVDYCRTRVEAAYKNQCELNPYSDNQFGSNKQRPAWMAQRSTMKQHGMHQEDETGIPESLRSTPSQPAASKDKFMARRIESATTKLKEMHRAFELNDYEDGLTIWPVTAKEASALDDKKKFALYQEALEAATEILAEAKKELGANFVQPEEEF